MRHGCLPRQYSVGKFWQKSARARRDTLTYRRLCRFFAKVNNPDYVHLLKQKNEFNRHFARFCRRDWIFPAEAAEEEFLKFLSRHDRVIIKPVDDYEGHGIYSTPASTLSEEEKHELYCKTRAEKTVVEELLTNHPRMTFGNSSLNTLRMTSMLDADGKCHIMSCVLRAGVGDTVVDNYASGGVIYNVDPELGIVDERGIQHSGRRDIMRHPGTDIIMMGYQLPEYDEACRMVREAHALIPQVRFIGWDVAVLPNRIELIEGNHDPDYELYEFISPGHMWRRIRAQL